MKEFRFKLIMILAFIGLSLYLLYPTYQDYQNTKEIEKNLTKFEKEIKVKNPTISEAKLQNLIAFKEDSIRVSNPSFKDAREKRLKLGLDLQGGMYLVLEVNTGKLLEKLANDPDETFNKLLAQAENEAKISDVDIVNLVAEKLKAKKIRLSRYFGSIRESDDQIIKKLRKQEADAVKRAIEIISNRVNQYGVSEPSIQPQGSRRIIVELPGIAKEEEAKRLLQGRALLEFTLLKEPKFTFKVMNAIDKHLAEVLTTQDQATKDSLTAKDSTGQLSEEEFAVKHPFYALAMINPKSQNADAFVKEKNISKLKNYLSRPDVKQLIPDNIKFVFSAKPITTENGEKIFRLYLVNKTPELTGGVITDAQANIDPQTTSPIVTMQMNSEGARDWARITGSNIGKRIAIILDGVVYSAPVVRGKIPGGRSQIEGMADLEEAKLLEIVLKAGALPAPIDIIEERTVGPSLGQDSIHQGFLSTIIGFLVVAFFMVFYYRTAGSIADLALFLTLLFVMGILAGFHATLTLPGIAGIILTIGMAVDANVLIYERIREEMQTGKTLKAAVTAGFENSYSAIFDSNLTTFFTGIILYQFGSGPVQGFALTLMIGIVSSLFAALVVSRLIFDLMVKNGHKINLG
jgi:preprotein translocase subunit SecD